MQDRGYKARLLAAGVQNVNDAQAGWSARTGFFAPTKFSRLSPDCS
jgi:hypothetical protein